MAKKLFKVINFKDGVHEAHVVPPWKAANKIAQVLPYVPQGAGEMLLKYFLAMGKSIPDAVEGVLEEVAESCASTYEVLHRLPTPAELDRHLTHAIEFLVASDLNINPTAGVNND